ncbi:hypothetical protein KSP40_PGU010093 [Platanthera guangdongensis]|uniref:FAR1 domain-containing protein n=1 Tax=Platanthera guangdongensis TaxID=2320717 RepID=A0ABR2MCY1_9ASPA
MEGQGSWAGRYNTLIPSPSSICRDEACWWLQQSPDGDEEIDIRKRVADGNHDLVEMDTSSEASKTLPNVQKMAEGDAEMVVKDEVLQTPPEELRATPEKDQALHGEVHAPPEEQALLVSQILRNYLQIKDTAVGDGGAESPADERCKAMLEVVLKEDGRWSVSKLETEHNHSLNISSNGDNGSKAALSIGMMFESVEATKDFYYGYSVEIGFKARTGSNRRSAATGDLIMQRFLCCRGNYPLQRRNLDTSILKRKRGPYNKRGKLLEDVDEKKDGDCDAVEVVDVDSSPEKRGVEGQCFDPKAETRPSAKSSEGGDCGAEVESRALVKSTASLETAADVKICGQPPATSVSSQSKILRELGVRVYRYSSDEKRDIILRYLMKKNNRQSGERNIKVEFLDMLALST